jgi:hypothetical protein
MTKLTLFTLTLAISACSSEDLRQNLQGFASGYTQTQAEIQKYHQTQESPVQRVIVQQPLMPLEPNVVRVTPVDQWGFPLH